MDDIALKMTEMKPDAVLLVSCHWQSTFHHYIDVLVHNLVRGRHHMPTVSEQALDWRNVCKEQSDL